MKVFYTPAKDGRCPSVIDGTKEVDGVLVSFWTGQTIEKMAERYPGILLGDAEAVAKECEAMMTTDPVRITEEQFNEALECLPPEGWIRLKSTESFKMCEYHSGRITSIYARLNDTHWTFKDVGSKTHTEIMEKVLKAATHVVYARRYGIVAEFPDTEDGTKAANEFIKANRGTGCLTVENGRVIIAKLADKGVPV